MSDPLLEELRERFRETSRARVSEMRSLLDALLRDAADPDAVRRLSRHFHALAGLGATYGFPLVSDLGDEGEGSILPFAREGHRPPDHVIARWREITGEIERDLAESAVGSRQSAEAFCSPAGRRPPTADRRRILAVEDEATQAELIRYILGTAGYEVEVCSDPETFDALLLGFAPDLLLADVQLTEKVTGHDLVRRARSNARFVAIPVIFVTGERERGMSSTHDGDPLIAKPVDWDALLKLIERML